MRLACTAGIASLHSVVMALDRFTVVHRFESYGDSSFFPHSSVFETNWLKSYHCSPSVTFVMISFLSQVLC